MNVLKSRTTRGLRDAGLVAPGRIIWARHGRTRHLFTAEALESAWNYVVYGQEKGADETGGA